MWPQLFYPWTTPSNGQLVVNWINFDSIYPLHSDLLGGLGYSSFEGGPERSNRIQTVLTSSNNLRLQYLKVSKQKVMQL